MLERRSFLRGLTTLPLIGGSVALIGRPTAAAVPVTPELLRLYGAFCWHELTRTTRVLKGIHGEAFDWNDYHQAFVDPLIAGTTPQGNAPVVLSAVGVPIDGGS